MGKLKEFFGAVGQNGINLFEDGNESLVNWKKGISSKSLAKDYLAGYFSTHIHLLLRVPLQHFQCNEFCTIFHRHPELSVHSEIKSDLTNRAWHFIVREKDSNLTHRVWSINDCSDSNWQNAMFVGVVKFMKKPQGMFQNIIPSMIWLQPLDECSHICGQVPNTRKSVFIIERRRGEDGEFRLGVRNGDASESELPSHMVKRTTEFVENISDNNSPLQRWGFENLDFENYLPDLVIQFGRQSTRVRIVKPLDNIIQGIEVINCPTEFELGTIQRMHMLYYHYGGESGKEAKDTQRESQKA